MPDDNPAPEPRRSSGRWWAIVAAAALCAAAARPWSARPAAAPAGARGDLSSTVSASGRALRYPASHRASADDSVADDADDAPADDYDNGSA